MIKVAFFAEIMIQDFDGASRTMFQIIDRIHNKDFEYMFIYGKGPDQFRNFSSFKTPVLRLPINDDYTLSLPALTKQKLYDQLDSFAPDVIHISTPSALGFFALKYAKKRNIPVISIYHTHFISYVPYYFKNLPFLVKPVEKWMTNTMRKFYNACSLIYAPTPSMMQDLTKSGIQLSKLNLWQRGIDLTLFHAEKRDTRILQRITKNKKSNILFASRLVWEKNIQTLIDIYKFIESNNLPYNIIVVGEGNAKKEAEEKMTNAFFLGKKSHQELSIIYASADVFLFTSTSETYGNVVIEAMASGLPCVIANGGGSADLINEGVTGFKCSPKNAEEYVSQIQQLLENPGLYNEIRNNGLKAVQQLDWNTLVEKYFTDVQALANKTVTDWTWVAS